MPAVKISVEQFLKLAEAHPVLDVRSPGEYNHAYIPGAYSFPLFDDEERKIVGTAYKQQSREEAIKIGLDFFGKKMRSMVEEAERILRQAQDDKLQTTNHKPHTILVHCWRGGMRSAGVAWLLDLYGFKVYTLTGGYKAFRNFALQQFEKKYAFNILGGYTGSGKTYVLKEMQKHGHAVIDLEKLANHKGSAFGALGEEAQPSQEMFENKLALELLSKGSSVEQNSGTDIWLEDESQRIGSRLIPKNIWEQMRCAPVYFLDIPFEERLKHIIAGYGAFNREELADSIVRIQKRLGGLETKNALNFLNENNTKACFEILLKYYDKLYAKGLHNRPFLEQQLVTILCNVITPENFKNLTSDKIYE